MWTVPYEMGCYAPSNNELATFFRGQPSQWTALNITKKEIHKNNYIIWIIVANAIQPISHMNFIGPQQAMIIEAIATHKEFCLVHFFVRQNASAIIWYPKMRQSKWSLNHSVVY